jgi:hypothetical protein
MKVGVIKRQKNGVELHCMLAVLSVILVEVLG